MQLLKEDNLWTIVVEDIDNQLGQINFLRNLTKLNDEIGELKLEGLIVNLDLNKLVYANSELIADFVMLQTSLVKNNGRFCIINANLELKSAFDVVMLDKIVSIQYDGLGEGSDSEEE